MLVTDVSVASAAVIFSVEKEFLKRTAAETSTRQASTVFCKTSLTWTTYHHQDVPILPDSNRGTTCQATDLFPSPLVNNSILTFLPSTSLNPIFYKC